MLGAKKKKEDAIMSVISVSKVTSIQEISDVSDISPDEVCAIIEKMITKSKNDSRYKLFKNAHINKKDNEVIIAKYTTSGGVAGFISKIIPASAEDWTCKFCGANNKAKNSKCTTCGANPD